MSQAKRSHVRAASKWREQVARGLAEHASPYATDIDERDGISHSMALILEGSACVNVHAAREHAKALILYGRHAARVRGSMPWPVFRDFAEANPGVPWPHLSGHDRAFARLGQRIIDALDGQPSECQGDRCVRGQATTSGHSGRPSPAQDALGLRARFHLDASGWVWRGPCPFCHGTGHNLRGVLPVVEWSAQARCSAFDGWQPSEGLRSTAEWQVEILDDIEFQDDDVAPVTRTVSRGQHRKPSVEVIERNGRRVELRDQMRGWIPKDSHECYDRRRPGPECWPRWRRGERRHVELQRMREAARARLAADDPIAAAVLAMQPAADEMAEAIGRLGRAAEGSIAALETLDRH